MKRDLKEQLIKELSRPEFKANVTDVFINQLKQNQLCPQGDLEEIVNFLIFEQESGENRRKVILHFLKVVEPYQEDVSLCNQLSDLFAYLLHTLIKKTEFDSAGVKKLTVQRQETVELINAVYRVFPFIPYSEDIHHEYRNGSHNPRLENIGDFFPPSGEWDVEKICQEIALMLLTRLGERNANRADSLRILNGRLGRYDLDLTEAPLHGLKIHEQKFSQHPFNISNVAERFTQATENRLTTYVYGVSGTENSCELLCDEEKIRGLVVENNMFTSANETLTDNKSGKEEAMGETGKNQAGNGIIFNGPVNNPTFTGGGSANSIHIGNNIAHSGDKVGNLSSLLEELKVQAKESDAIDKSKYAAISTAIDEIKRELQKKEAADRNLLTKAKQALEALVVGTHLYSLFEKISELFE